eukprot:CAMPEP_0202978704 /NCGR_PEP_ID=MMETSP1396-20130829/85051_1 /ASSEMBLY_ACC=CAM_ASM_000872 /TAXON_ID= /ORGANISM="Pseudokeronopsis sp., Strain Brazil" /LENGTH=43 /DNA_ID= /DNA_START= /DNA_END= /DNA_ORIENTATION=
MDLSRFEFNKFEEIPEVFEVPLLVQEVIDIVEVSAQGKGVKLF